MKTPYNKLVKIYANCLGHMTKMADMSIYGKKPLKIFFSRTRRLMTLGLGTVKTLYNVTRYNRIFSIRHKIAGNGSVSIKIPSL